uniref:ZSWIM3 N-terminal domain-containing protein n=1 Tax=Amphimedon queenslandica TaxID=400682 RepID=A0A1X7SD72_AMPQE
MEYERYNAIQMSRRDSRTLEAAAKRVPKRVEGAPSKLKYYEANYTCIFGGKAYKRKGNGIRKHQSTIKQGCNAGVKLVLSGDKRHLEVTYVSESHNHIMNK